MKDATAMQRTSRWQIDDLLEQTSSTNAEVRARAMRSLCPCHVKRDETRPHDDVEIAIFRNDQSHLHRHLPGWSFEKIVESRHVRWDAAAERLLLPVHEVHARSPDHPPRSLEFLLNERTADEWVFRRDPAIRLAVDRAILRSERGMLPVLCPQ